MEEERQEKLPIDAKLLSEAVIELNISRRSVGLYPTDHPILKGSINRAFELLKKLFELRNSITLGVAKDALIIDEYTLERKNPVFQEFALSLHSRGIASVTFYSGLEAEELVGLHELITMREGPTGEGLLELAEEKGLRHIKITPVDFSVFSFKEGQRTLEAPEGMLWENYVYGLLEGKLAEGDAEDVIIAIPPEQVASIINRQMQEDAPEETYDRVISTYLRRKGERRAKSETVDRFSSFVSNLTPELKAQFLQRSLSHTSTETDEAEEMLAGLKEEDLRRLLEVFQERSSKIPESLKNLIDKLIETRSGGEQLFDVAAKGKAFVDDIEIGEDVVKLFEEDHFRTFVSEEYQRELDRMIKGIETEEGQLTEVISQESSEREIDRGFSEVILELLRSDSINREDYLRLLTKLSELVEAFLDTGRFQEVCDIYNAIYSYSITGEFKPEASSMIDYTFRSEQSTQRIIEAFKLWGRYDRNSALALARVLKIYLISPLLDTFSEETDPNVSKFYLYLLSNMGREVAQEAVGRLNDEREFVVRSMIVLIRECGGRSYLKYIRPFVKHKDKKICIEVVKTLLQFGTRDALSCLKTYLMSEDPDLREQAVVLSGTYKVRDMVPHLIGFLQKRDILGTESYYKIPVVRALGHIGDPRAIEPLRRLYNQKGLLFSSARNELRLEIFRNLKGYPASAIKPLLELGFRSRNKEIRSIAERLSKEIQPSGDDVDA